MIQFFAPDIETDGFLTEEDTRHCMKVLRHKTGDEIFVTDGKGNRFRCSISEVSGKRAFVNIIEKTFIPSGWNNKITLVISPTKNSDRMEWLMEKAVEIGIDNIILIKCDHSERKQINTSRLQKIMISAMKQSLKTKLPELTGIMPSDEYLDKAGTIPGFKFVGYCDDSIQRNLLSRSWNGSEDITVMIGPEGDFSPREIKSMINSGFIPVSFGDSRLRTETAALFALSQIHTIIQLNT